MQLIRVPPCFFCGSLDVVVLYTSPPIPIMCERPRWTGGGERYKAIFRRKDSWLSVWIACETCDELIRKEHLVTLVDRCLGLFGSLGTRADEKFRIALLTAYRMFLESRDEGRGIIRRSDASPEVKALIDEELEKLLDELGLEMPGEEELDQSS